MMRMMIYAVLLLIFLKISLSDWKMHRILNRDLIWICMLAVPICLADPRGFLTEYLPGVFAVSIPMALLLFFIPGSFGGGDIKFTAAAGLVLGTGKVLLGSMAAVLFAGVYCLYLLVWKKEGRKAVFAFGPFLCMGMTAALLFGEQMVAWLFS